ncbi:hypothetical protein [Methylobacterium sp. Gmos1]
MSDEPRRVWVIEGRSGVEIFFRSTIGFELATEVDIIAMLQRLACRHLAPHKVLNASLRDNDRSYNSLLAISKDTGEGRDLLTTQLDPHYTARSETDRDLPDLDEARPLPRG